MTSNRFSACEAGPDVNAVVAAAFVTAALVTQHQPVRCARCLRFRESHRNQSSFKSGDAVIVRTGDLTLAHTTCGAALASDCFARSGGGGVRSDAYAS